MKFLLVLTVALACVAADVSHLNNIVRSSYDISPEGNYNYVYETSKGIYAEASGSLKNVQGENPAIEVQGGFKYTSPEGIPIETTYIANENGFQPQGKHLPVAPAIPEYIARSLQYIADHPPKQTPY